MHVYVHTFIHIHLFQDVIFNVNVHTATSIGYYLIFASKLSLEILFSFLYYYVIKWRFLYWPIL